MILSKIERLAYSLLNELEIYEPHVPIEEVAKKLGLKVINENFDSSDISGVLHRNDKESIYVIGVNSAHGENRRRFTIAHEIGHFLLHKGQTTHFDRGSFTAVNYRNSLSSTATVREEIEANSFAAALLMPEKFVHHIVEQELSNGFNISNDDNNEINEIAKIFKVSPQALSIRLGKLGYV